MCFKTSYDVPMGIFPCDFRDPSIPRGCTSLIARGYETWLVLLQIMTCLPEPDHMSSPVKLGTDFQDSLYFHKIKGNQKVTKGNRRFISGLESPEYAKSVGNGYWRVSYVAETRSAPNSRGERSVLLWSRFSFFEMRS